jgi:hypothetical protein
VQGGRGEGRRGLMWQAEQAEVCRAATGYQGIRACGPCAAATHTPHRLDAGVRLLQLGRVHGQRHGRQRDDEQHRVVEVALRRAGVGAGSEACRRAESPLQATAAPSCPLCPCDVHRAGCFQLRPAVRRLSRPAWLTQVICGRDWRGVVSARLLRLRQHSLAPNPSSSSPGPGRTRRMHFQRSLLCDPKRKSESPRMISCEGAAGADPVRRL